jgi:hypothetical protein
MMRNNNPINTQNDKNYEKTDFVIPDGLVAYGHDVSAPL